MRDDRLWLLDMLEAIEKIEKYATKGKQAFYEEELIQVWTIYYIQVIGEAANQLSTSIRQSQREIPWSNVTAMRNVLVHHYFGLDLDEIWDTVCIDLPILKAKIQEILAEI
ncbi:MAG: DUF86 domain-containing protein [Methanotrichaceae archaeon]